MRAYFTTDVMDESKLRTIKALTELDRIGWVYEYCGEEEVKCRCPAHEDSSPSASVNVIKNVWQCHASGCKKGGDIVSFLAFALKTTRTVVYEDLCTRYKALKDEKLVEGILVEKYHERIWDAKPLVKELVDRGANEEMIRYARLGEWKGRVSIPVVESGNILNIRFYAPGAPGADKFKNLRGYGKIALYQADDLKYDKIVICGGEMKALVTGWYTRKKKIGAIAPSGGEGNWHPEFTKRLKGKKKVWILYDVDDDGIVGANQLAAMLATHVEWVGVIQLPLDTKKYPHGDVNDWFGQEGATAQDLYNLLEATPEWVKPKRIDDVKEDEEASPVSLVDTSKSEWAGKRISVKATVTAVDNTPYLVPRVVRCHCTRDQPLCISCPVYAETADENGYTNLTISAQSPGLLDMVDSSRKMQPEATKDALRIPPCKVVQFNTLEYYTLQDVRLTPPLELTNRTDEHVMRPAYVLSENIESNQAYMFKARVWPHPKTQQAIILADGCEPAEDSLGQFRPSADEVAALDAFKVGPDGLEARLTSIYDDLSANVTRIFMRRSLHFAIDLAYHSPLLIDFDGRIEKGWAEVLVVGDSAQGKSETGLRLMQHYGLGERVDCKNATVAGLVGGLQQINGRYFVVWGKYPTNDKRIIHLEEVKGASTEVLSKMTDMRSSGIAQLPKIEKRQTHARTRSVWYSNPRRDQSVSSYNFGLEVVSELMGSLEDVRRFDFALVVAASEVDAKHINQLNADRPKVSHAYTSELCRRLVLWAWTREPSQIQFTAGAVKAVLDESNRLCEAYTEAVPLVDRGSMRFKLARLAASLAARVFSTDDGERLIVRSEHVTYVSQFIDDTYSSPVFGYRDFSSAVAAATRLDDPKKIKERILSDVPYPKDFIDKLLYTNEITFTDICDWCGWGRDEATKLMSFMVRKNALQRCDRVYRKTPGFIELLKAVRDSGEAAGAEPKWDRDSKRGMMEEM